MGKLGNFSAKQMPSLVLSTTYGKPLLRGAVSDLVDPHRIMARFQRTLLNRLKKFILQATFSDAAKRRLSKAIKVKLKGNSIQVTTRDPAWRPLVEGQKPGQMRWLIRARAPIPIVTDTGKVIFRSATAKSMKNGRWYHPGRPRQNIIEKAKEEARKILRERVKSEFAKQLRDSLR
jgi:hypothetical protein